MDLLEKEKSQIYTNAYFKFKERLYINRSFQHELTLEKGAQQALTKYPKESSLKLLLPNPKLSTLELITIKELEMGKTHRGKYLKVRFLLHCYFNIGIIGLCEDCTSQRSRCMQAFVIHFDLKSKHYDAYFSPDTIIYVKEPVLKFSQTGPILIIDRQEDILFERDDEVLGLNKTKQQIVSAMLEQYRRDGLNYMKTFRFGQAFGIYTRAIDYARIQKGEKDQIFLKFVLNKAIACAKLNLLDQYAQNVQQALCFYPQDKKANYHQIKCLIEAQLYELAKSFCKDKKYILDEKTMKELANQIQFQRAFNENKINWYKVFKEKKLGHYQSSAIEIQKKKLKVCFRQTPVAQRNIKAGQILIIQKPLLWTEYQSTEAPLLFQENIAWAQLINSIQDLTYYSPQFKRQYSKLSFGQLQQSIGPSVIQQMRVEKHYELNQLQQFFSAQIYKETADSKPKRTKKDADKISSNLLNIYPQSKNKLGLFRTINQIQHCCQPNCQRLCIGETMIIFSKRQIKKGQYLTVAQQRDINFARRKFELKCEGIQCDCKMCEFQTLQTYGGAQQKYSEEIQITKLINRVAKYGDKDALSKLQIIQTISIPIIVAFAKHGEILKAAEKFRALFPMSLSQSQEILMETVKSAMK